MLQGLHTSSYKCDPSYIYMCVCMYIYICVCLDIGTILGMLIVDGRGVSVDATDYCCYCSMLSLENGEGRIRGFET